MKKLITTVCSIVLLMLAVEYSPAIAQESERGQLFTIHHDVVIPAKVQQYEKAAKNLSVILRQHGIKSMRYNVANTMDFDYLYITPIEGYGDVDEMEGAFAELEQKMGKEQYAASMSLFDNCYDSHRDYMVRLRNDLSYNPEYGMQASDDMLYRNWDFFYPYPGKQAEMMDVIQRWQKLYNKHGIREGYRVYMGDMGTDMPLVIVVQSAKNPASYALAMERTMKKLGTEGEKLWGETLALLRKFDAKTGSMRPDLEYQPAGLATASEPEN